MKACPHTVGKRIQIRVLGEQMGNLTLRRYVHLNVLFWALTAAVVVSHGCTPARAEFLTPAQVLDQLNSDGFIPQGIPKAKYHPLSDVIPDDEELKKLKIAKAKRRKLIMRPWWMDYVVKGKPIQGVDLRQWDSPIRSQWDGTCTAHGTIAGLENLLNREKAGHFLSTRYHWSRYHQYSGAAAMSALAKNQQIDNECWPQEKKKPAHPDYQEHEKYQLLDGEYLGSDYRRAVDAVAKGQYPVNIAMSVPRDMASCRAAIRFSSGLTAGGHDLLISGVYFSPNVEGGGYFILKNSWGTQCADHGYQYLPFAYCEKADVFCMFWSLKVAAAKPDVHASPSPLASPVAVP